MSIEIQNLSYIYNEGSAFEKKALDGINLSIADGQFTGLIGHTGSGKSTLIQHLNGLLKPTAGEIRIGGEIIRAVPKQERKKESKKEKTRAKEVLRAIRRQVGLVFQYPEHQLFEVSVYKDVAFGPGNLGLSRDEIDDRVRRALSAVGIGEDLYEKSPFEISGGQKRRAAIAGVLAMEPQILVLDEPTAGLDPRGRDEILDKIKEMHETLGITILLVSHSMEDIARLVERIVVLHEGTLVYNGTPREVFRHARELESIGLAAPQISYLMQTLAEEGYPVPTDIFTAEEAAEVLAGLLRQVEQV